MWVSKWKIDNPHDHRKKNAIWCWLRQCVVCEIGPNWILTFRNYQWQALFIHKYHLILDVTSALCRTAEKSLRGTIPNRKVTTAMDTITITWRIHNESGLAWTNVEKNRARIENDQGRIQDYFFMMLTSDARANFCLVPLSNCSYSFNRF